MDLRKNVYEEQIEEESRFFQLACGLKVKAGTVHPAEEGDSRHGCYAYVGLFPDGADMKGWLKRDKFGNQSIEIAVGGYDELTNLIDGLEYAADVLKRQRMAQTSGIYYIENPEQYKREEFLDLIKALTWERDAWKQAAEKFVNDDKIFALMDALIQTEIEKEMIQVEKPEEEEEDVANA